jgi:hypothetical protein
MGLPWHSVIKISRTNAVLFVNTNGHFTGPVLPLGIRVNVTDDGAQRPWLSTRYNHHSSG